MTILGVGGVLSDPAAAVVRDGKLAAAVEQVKLTRAHKRGELPEAAIREVLRLSNARPEAVDCAALVRPLGAGAGADVHLALRAMLPNAKVILVDHHTAHAAAAYFASPFDEATVLTLDRSGDLRCGALWRGEGASLQIEKETYYPDSVGDIYGRVTALLGFAESADEHKVQWLSTAGSDRFVPVFRGILAAQNDNWPRMDRSYFDSHGHRPGGFSAKLYKGLELEDGAAIPVRMRADVARGIQGAIEETVLAMAGRGKNLALGGGLAMNALLVAALERSGNWENVWVQPAGGNAGNAIGSALYGWHAQMKRTERVACGNLCLGPEFSAEEIKQVLENCKLRFKYLLTTEELVQRAVEELNGNKIIAWMHGRMEFGPRALGNRSILASPLNPYSTENLNQYIKHRESFRKFAASVPAELADRYFDAGPNARYLATVGKIKPQHKETFASALLGKDWIRVHAVRREDNQAYWELLHAFGKSTGLPVLFNTSFNLFGDPLVCSPRDAVRSFYSSGIDSLFAGQFLVQK